MANVYTHFSEVIRALTPDEERWVDEATQDVEHPDEERYADIPRFLADNMELAKRVEIDEEQDCCGFEISFKDCDNIVGGPRDMYVTASEGGDNPAMAAMFLMLFFQKFRPRETLHMRWAEVCDKEIPGAFGGGGVFICADGVSFIDIDGFFKLCQEAFDKRHGVPTT